MSEVAERVRAEFGQVDILVHSLAYAPEVTKPLLETSREGYGVINLVLRLISLSLPPVALLTTSRIEASTISNDRK
eukprot:CAMPEP_0118957546 /NCGR_PEP_ID=MMETSP1169-20130426/62161_1 /TAXON_ID=36882 /ORGANISM="Pyramimonas obovata, Strain CCMP722" /LENGTH=75 /DNA_ID=CAMNT_0006905633 /DNA_START=174 /DNA_END=400 /DNA_ORIENTATION=+